MKVNIIETVLRDANESSLNNHMYTEDMLPILSEMDEAGFYAINCWGGQVFEAAFASGDDPWKRLLALKKGLKKTPLLMEMQGARIFADALYPDAMVESFVEICAECGINILRIYDRDNNLANLETTIRSAKENKVCTQVALLYKQGTGIDAYIELAKSAVNLGTDSIIICDKEGRMTPYFTGSLFSALSEQISVPLGIQMLQSHGLAEMCYLKAIENGCSYIDTTCTPLSSMSGNPATEVFAEVLRGMDIEAGLRMDNVSELTAYFAALSDEYQANGVFTADKMGLHLNEVSLKTDVDAKKMVYESINDEDIHEIRSRIALIEQSPLDAVTFALYPDTAMEYFHSRIKYVSKIR